MLKSSLILILLIVCTNCDELGSFIDAFFGDVNLNIATCWNKGFKRRFLSETRSWNSNRQISFEAKSNGNCVIDLKGCRESWMLLEKVASTSENCLVFVDSIDEFREQIENYHVAINNMITAAYKTESGYSLMQFYKVQKRPRIVWETYGEWSKNNGLIKYLKSPVALRRRNMQGQTYEVDIVLDDDNSMKHLEDFRFASIDAYSKQHYGPVMRLMEYLNISAKFHQVRNYSQRNYSPQLRSLFTLTAPYMTTDLIKTMDFVRVQKAPKICVLLKEPPASYVMAIFTVAFHSYVWYAIFLILLLVCAAMFVILNVEARRQKIKYKDHFTVFDLALIALEAVCQQGTSTDPSSYSGRILAVILFCAFMFLYVSYSANLLVLLQSTVDVKNLDEVREYNIDYGGMNTSAMKHYHSGIGDKLFSDRILADALYTVPEGMKRVQDGLFAFVSEIHYSYDYVKEQFSDYDVCSLQEIQCYPEMNMGYIGLPKGSPFKEIFKVALLRIDEFGMFRRHFNMYFLKPQCYSKGSSFDTVGIAETYQAMFLIVFGVFVALGFLLIEKALFHYVEKRNLTLRDMVKKITNNN